MLAKSIFVNDLTTLIQNSSFHRWLLFWQYLLTQLPLLRSITSLYNKIKEDFQPTISQPCHHMTTPDRLKRGPDARPRVSQFEHVVNCLILPSLIKLRPKTNIQAFFLHRFWERWTLSYIESDNKPKFWREERDSQDVAPPRPYKHEYIPWFQLDTYRWLRDLKSNFSLITSAYSLELKVSHLHLLYPALTIKLTVGPAHQY
jgi:hypothetical protein